MISVVVATYGTTQAGYARDELLDRALYTYSRQTIEPSEWEYLICDDGSTDNTASVIKKWSKKLPIRPFTAEELGKPKVPGKWRDGCALRNALSTFANGSVIVSTHPEIMIPPDALEAMRDAVLKDPRAWVTAIPYWLPPTEAYHSIQWKKDINKLNDLEGFYDPTWPNPITSPGAVDYRNQNQEVRPTWESEVFWAMSMAQWRYCGGFREFDAWGSVDMDWLHRRTAMGIPTAFAFSKWSKRADSRLMVYHQHHESQRNMNLALSSLKGMVYPTPQAARSVGGLYAVWNHGPRERPVDGKADTVLGDHQSRYEFANIFAHEKDILDIPCGTGYGAAILAGARSYTGIDIDEESIDYARANFSGKNRLFSVGNMAHLTGTPDESFDMVVCFEGLEHISMDGKHAFFSELYRVLRPGGTFIISTPQLGATSGTPWDRYMITFEQLTSLIGAAGFIYVDWFYQTHYGDKQTPKAGFPPSDAEVMVVGGTKPWK